MKTDLLLAAARRSLGIPLTPAPCRLSGPCAAWTVRPGRCDGTVETARFLVRVYDETPQAAWSRTDALRRALTGWGDQGALGTGAGTILCVRTREDAGSGRDLPTGLYYVQSSFDCQSRAD